MSTLPSPPPAVAFLRRPLPHRVIDIRGEQYGRLTVREFQGMSEGTDRRSLWRCECECGATVIVKSHNLRTGCTASCGCLHADHARIANNRIRNGRFKSALNAIYSGMLFRCQNMKHHAYRNYGGRGITVCERWCGENGFANFSADVGARPSLRHTIDRIDNDGNYEPSNWRWATKRQQARNARFNRILMVGTQRWKKKAMNGYRHLVLYSKPMQLRK